MKQLFYSGTSGILLPFRNQAFYPENFQGQSRLQVYSQLNNSLEVNSIFYKMPLAKTVAKWAAEVPHDFRFTFKMPKQITHVPNLEFDAGLVRDFMSTIAKVGGKKGCILIQLPPSANIKLLKRLNYLLEEVSKNNEDAQWKVCVEFRHDSWYDAATYNMLDERNTGIVFHDKNKSGTNLEETQANFIYLRFHGPNGDYRESYDDSLLAEYSGYINDWLEAGKEVYVYFNNTIGNALENLNMLNTYVADSQ